MSLSKRLGRHKQPDPPHYARPVRPEPVRGSEGRAGGIPPLPTGVEHRQYRVKWERGGTSPWYPASYLFAANVDMRTLITQSYGVEFRDTP